MIYDTDGNAILSATFAVDSAGSQTFTIMVDCETGKTLSSNTVADVTVEGRLSGGGGWTNLESSSIDLGTWNGTQQDFNIRLTAGTITTYTRRAVQIIVG